MMGFIIVFLAGGFFGMLGMSLFSAGPKVSLFRENNLLRQRLEFLENEGVKKRFTPVHDPRQKVHSLVN